MTRKEFIANILSDFDNIAEEVPSNSVEGVYVKKVLFTKETLRIFLSLLLSDSHITWKE